MSGRAWRRLVGPIALLCLPGALAFAALYALGLVAAGPAALAAAATAAATALAALPLAASLSGVRAAIEGWLADPAAMAGRARKGLPLAVARLWRAAEGRGSEAAAAEFIGTVGEPRDLAASLRNPALLAAADAVLRGEGPRVVEFSLSVPVERVLSARLARIDGPPLDGAAAILTLHDITGLKRAEQMRADFIANAGHELKTPLATLIGFIETLLGPARDDAAARERFLGIMQGQATRMARLVDDLLSLSRIELNEHVAPTARVALPPLVEHIAAAHELRAGERGIRLVLSLPADLPEVLGDADELAQVFQNLLDNAIKYGRPDTQVSVAAEAGGGFVRVAVIDQGEGIASDQLPRLTERFYRVDTARSRELGGTGLGLAIVKHILNRNRGRLEIDSALGVGSTFTVWLRAAAPAVTEP